MKTSISKENKLTLINVEEGDFVVTLCDLGAAFYGIKLNDDEMILRVKDSSDFLLPDLYYGKTIGRVCGRLLTNPLEIRGQQYFFQDNDKGASLHGGFDGLSAKFFSYEIEENKDHAVISFSYLSKDGEAGYPGNLLLKVIYTIYKNRIDLKMIAEVDKPCLLALTNHAYFNLGESKKDDLCLKVSSSKCVECDSKLLPIGLKDVDEKWNFKEGKLLSLTGDIDNYFLFDGEPVAVLQSPKYRMTVKTDFEGIQVYSDNFYTDVKVTSSDLTKYRSVAIEPEDNPLNRKVLEPAKTYERNIEYRFEVL